MIKAYPITCHEDKAGEERYSSTLPLTSVLDWGGWLTPCPGHFTPRKEPEHSVPEAGWAPGLVLVGVENLSSPGLATRTFQPEASRYTD